MEPVSLAAVALGVAVVRAALRCVEIYVSSFWQIRRERARRENFMVLLEAVPAGYSLHYGPEGDILLVPTQGHASEDRQNNWHLSCRGERT